MRDEDVAVLQQVLLDIADHIDKSNKLLASVAGELHDIRKAIQEIE